MAFLLQISLLVWFFISLYLVAIDPTLSLQLKITGEILNLLSIGFIATNMIDTCTNTVLYYSIAAILLGWYLYYTNQDWNNAGYSPAKRYGYTALDIAFIIYISTSTLLNIIGMVHEKLSIAYDIIRFKGLLFGSGG